ncbi:FecR family protein [bacterium]|nr:FecR family protein [bacterium]
MNYKKTVTRRRFIKVGSQLIIFPLFGTQINSCGKLLTPQLVEWTSLVQTNDHAGEIIIDAVEGDAMVNNVSVVKGLKLKNGVTLELKTGVVFMSLPDGSVLKLSKKATVEFDVDSRKGGIIILKQGGLLAVVRKSTQKPYLIRNASALVGIKGTVFYTQVLSPEDKQQSNIPDDASDYFCICNGIIDYLDQQWNLQKTSKGVHHMAYFLKTNGQNIDFEYAGWLLNHSDDEIYKLIETMKGEKHPTDWIQGDSYQNDA